MGLEILAGGMLVGWMGVVLAGAEANPAVTRPSEAPLAAAAATPATRTAGTAVRDVPRVTLGTAAHSHAPAHSH